MKNLYNLIKGLKYKTLIANNKNLKKIILKGLYHNSLQIKNDTLFVALKGKKYDGHIFINDAIKKGATVILCSNMPNNINNNIIYIIVKDVLESIGIISSNYYDNPTKFLKLIGITGTDGKTTIATLLFNLFLKLGYKVALISTIVTKIINEKFYNEYTTPDIITINKYLKRAVDKNCLYAFIEISSHSIKQKRIFGLNFTGGIFTNITSEHIDYHKNFNDYLLTKVKFFKSLREDAFALINLDDINHLIFIKNCKAKIITYSINKISNYNIKILIQKFYGTKISIDNNSFWIKLIGIHNVYNILAVYATTNILLKYNKLQIIKSISELNPVNGRAQLILYNNIKIIIDYAHTPNALKNILHTINGLKEKEETLICLIGCGGNRDKNKRYDMGIIACKYADKVIFTSDNPRYENPKKIINDMIYGINNKLKYKISIIINRYNAIHKSIMLPDKKKIILIAGKGHEKFQEIKGLKKKFNDLESVKKIINKCKKNIISL